MRAQAHRPEAYSLQRGLAGDSSGLLRPHRVARVPGEPAEETTYGQGTAKAAFYATIFWIALFLCFYFVPVAYFDP